jgi:hypothetical protein
MAAIHGRVGNHPGRPLVGIIGNGVMPHPFIPFIRVVVILSHGRVLSVIGEGAEWERREILFEQKYIVHLNLLIYQ